MKTSELEWCTSIVSFLWRPLELVDIKSLARKMQNEYFSKMYLSYCWSKEEKKKAICEFSEIWYLKTVPWIPLSAVHLGCCMHTTRVVCMGEILSICMTVVLIRVGQWHVKEYYTIMCGIKYGVNFVVYWFIFFCLWNTDPLTDLISVHWANLHWFLWAVEGFKDFQKLCLKRSLLSCLAVKMVPSDSPCVWNYYFFLTLLII